ncbi:unnamed protein product [Cuscuta campestris]|uniref:CHCH domain-containing protein n=2 Tax=Cuscuta sect. Cleistogrammica TaxID=1824901 RepID=A0A484KVR5_9ASTE|nr:hypothetical protein DM860_007116 [Cuscuta australis]VFQ68688.1 unnamed protein product [Cuscuta campestris]
MDADQRSQPVCGQEALTLLNCTTETPYDTDKCARLLQELRQCVLSKKVKKFSLVEPNDGKSDALSGKMP